MTTVLRASPRRFVSTPAIERVAARALRYLQSGYSVHLRGPAGTGKTTLALHLADMLARPLMLIFGDDEFKTSDLIGNQSGYTRKKVVDNFIHSVVKVEDELRQNWVDSRLTLACREGFTLVYDEFNRSRPEVNNVLLSALEEKLLVLPPSNNRSEYVRVSPHFRAIFTSNPEEYCGVHATQDALMDRLVTINIPEPDELAQQEIVVQKTEIDRVSALTIVRLVRAFRASTKTEKASGLRSCLMLAKICQEHGIAVSPENADFRDVCCDILLSRAGASLEVSTRSLWDLLNHPASFGIDDLDELMSRSGDQPEPDMPALDLGASDIAALDGTAVPPEIAAALSALAADATTLVESPQLETAPPNQLQADLPEASLAETSHTQVDAASAKTIATASVATLEPEKPASSAPSSEQKLLQYLQRSSGARLSQIEKVLRLDRFQTVNTLHGLIEQGKVIQRDRLYYAKEA